MLEKVMAELRSEMIPDMDMSGCAANEPFALRVIDDSMEPEFAKDALIIIDPSGFVKDGVFIIALIENGYIFRQLKIENDCYFIQPLNEEYKHERREIRKEQIEGVIIQQAAPNGRRKDRKHYKYED